MKVSEAIQEFIPCEICGNNDVSNFYFYVLADSRVYVKCCECQKEYVSINIRNALVMAEKSRKARIGSRITLKNINQESVHPLVKVLAQI